MTTVEMLKIQFDDSYHMLKEFVQICPDILWAAENHGLPIWNHVIHTLNGTDFWLRDNYNQEYRSEFPFPENLCDTLSRDEWCHPSDGFMTKSEIGRCFDILDKKLDIFWDKLTDDKLHIKIWDNLQFTYFSVILSQIRHIMCHVGMCNSALLENGYEEVKWLALGEERI